MERWRGQDREDGGHFRSYIWGYIALCRLVDMTAPPRLSARLGCQASNGMEKVNTIHWSSKDDSYPFMLCDATL